jgi:hypothetical protein
MIVVMTFILGFLVIGAFGIFSFEITTNNSARDELRSACEAAALAGAAALCSSNSTDPTTAHNNAEAAAQQTFVSNSVLGVLLSNTRLLDSQNSTAAAALASNPPLNGAIFYVEFLKADGTVAAWSDGAGQVTHVCAVFGEQPPFGQYMNLLQTNVTAQAEAGVPPMDIVMCFDVSDSIDDQSKVSCVKRWWNGSAIQYDIAKTNTGAAANGTIYQIFQPSPVGSGINLEHPQELSAGGGGMSFDPTLRAGPSGTESGAPPGNYPGTSTSSNPSDYTDMVANLDGKTAFSPPYTYVDPSGTSWSFPSLGAVVEAQRGNLENPTVFANSMANTSMPAGFSPRAGYQAAYFNAAHNLAMPIGAARVAAAQFFQIMSNSSNANFGVVCFGSGISTSPTKTSGTTNAIAWNYAAGGKVTPPFPGVTLGTNNLNTIENTVIPNTVAYGGTDIGDAAIEAVNELVTSGRPGTIKAVVFFTDGQPNQGPSWLSAAQKANKNGIAIYTVGMAQNSGIIPGECNNLNDAAGKAISYTDPITGTPSSYTPSTPGMAAVAGNGGKFFLVTNTNDLAFVFENIARQLVHL